MTTYQAIYHFKLPFICKCGTTTHSNILHSCSWKCSRCVNIVDNSEIYIDTIWDYSKYGYAWRIEIMDMSLALWFERHAQQHVVETIRDSIYKRKL